MADFSLLDRPEIRSVMFYPQRERSLPPPGARDLFVPVEAGVQLHARIYDGSSERPTVILFHGNGEIVPDYDSLSTLYGRFGLNLVVSDYRGYGQSTGSPSFTSMMADAHILKAAVLLELEALGRQGVRLLMGRSLGALSAVEIASTNAAGLSGLVIESGAANLRGWVRFAGPGEESAWTALAEAQRERLAAIRLPLLTIHGAEDELIPLERALEAHEAAGASAKELVVIPEAGHNDLLAAGMTAYFEALSAFAARCEQG